MNDDAMCEATVLLVPKDVRESVLRGGAELVVERRDGELGCRRFLHLLDEDERRDRVQSKLQQQQLLTSNAHAVHTAQLEALRWARDTLWSDERLQLFLPGPSAALWPTVERLAEAVEVVRQLKVYADDPPDTRGGENLVKALDVVRREARHTGLHELKPAPVAGVLTPYEASYKAGTSDAPDQPPRTPCEGHVTSSTADVAAAEPISLKLSSLRVAPAALLLEVNNPVLIVPEVLRLPCTLRAQTRLIELLTPPTGGDDMAGETTMAASEGTPPRRWRSLIELHRQCLLEHRVGLVYSVQEAMQQFAMSERALAVAMTAATQAGRRVRLRGGMYATVLHREQLFLLLLTDSSATVASHTAATLLNEDERAAFARLTGYEVVECQDAGLVQVRVAAPTVSDAQVVQMLRETFCSPVLDASEPNIRRVVELRTLHLLGAVRVIHARAAFNPFVILHGARVEGGFMGDAAIFDALKRSRDAAAEEQTERLLRRGYRQAGHDEETSGVVDFDDDDEGEQRRVVQGESGVNTMTGSLSSMAMSGEEVRTMLARALIQALSDGPLTRAELLRHPAFARYARLPDFDVLLKATLKTHAEYRNRKYSLR